ncbi:hypothetical protein GOBAR_DD31156 [Gossypium barbadense]|uniref:Uncharacterized protein n=1 Tax=Gossypium tomentosum TaxID=34277 RepID=A0A5D2K6J4_GOSTO|nr:hypothetical protein GOBAR_DD31156 [Gossypium barbadense]TYH62761.1 hypothetical protein ES332_D07G142100v1 [Gossypium tomentosum]
MGVVPLALPNLCPSNKFFAQSLRPDAIDLLYHPLLLLFLCKDLLQQTGDQYLHEKCSTKCMRGTRLHGLA